MGGAAGAIVGEIVGASAARPANGPLRRRRPGEALASWTAAKSWRPRGAAGAQAALIRGDARRRPARVRRRPGRYRPNGGRPGRGRLRTAGSCPGKASPAIIMTRFYLLFSAATGPRRSRLGPGGTWEKSPRGRFRGRPKVAAGHDRTTRIRAVEWAPRRRPRAAAPEPDGAPDHQLPGPGAGVAPPQTGRRARLSAGRAGAGSTRPGPDGPRGGTVRPAHRRHRRRSCRAWPGGAASRASVVGPAARLKLAMARSCVAMAAARPAATTRSTRGCRRPCRRRPGSAPAGRGACAGTCGPGR